jgi:hypothetical protein
MYIKVVIYFTYIFIINILCDTSFLYITANVLPN